MATSISGDRSGAAVEGERVGEAAVEPWWRSRRTAPARGGRRRSIAAARATTTQPAAPPRISQACRLSSTSGRTLRTASVPAADGQRERQRRREDAEAPREPQSQLHQGGRAPDLPKLLCAEIAHVRCGSPAGAADRGGPPRARVIVPADGPGARKFLDSLKRGGSSSLRSARGIHSLAPDETAPAAVTWPGRASLRALSLPQPSWHRLLGGGLLGRRLSWRGPSWR